MIDRFNKAFNSALKNKNPELLEELVKKGIKLDPQQVLNILYESDSACEEKPCHRWGFFSNVLSKGCDDWNHHRPELRHKSKDDAKKWILALIASKADLNNQHYLTGNTALMWASYQGFDECVQLLLENKADATITNKKGDTAFEIAANRPMGAKCAKFLLGAMPTIEQPLEKSLTA